MRWLAAILAVPVLFAAWQWWNDRTIEHRLQPIARSVSGRHVTVDCQSFWGNLIDAQGREGEVQFDAAGIPEARLFLTRSTCGRLRAFAGRSHHGELDCLTQIDWGAPDPLPFDSACYHASADTIYAVLVLAHESYHTIGVSDEAATNCYAIQAMAWTAVELGAAPEEAELIARAMEVLEPKQDAPYGTNECHAGGQLDLHPGTPAFPTEHPLAPPLGTGGMPALLARA
jgi:hypothetical protein